MTAAEARVAAAAFRGEGSPSIAKELAVSANTVRTHRQHVFEKTGTHRQAELVRVLTASLSRTAQFVERNEEEVAPADRPTVCR
ncbi:LuxR C-terminal-related transcriptional regulator [Nocardia sp. CA-084685]|uniref:LuxR C-terminal-related transcriptional regulator n=1 Tax=Nocardia sp. CA-084685 TaxID=3239970 RepID=UPI003D97BAE0